MSIAYQFRIRRVGVTMRGFSNNISRILSDIADSLYFRKGDFDEISIVRCGEPPKEAARPHGIPPCGNFSLLTLKRLVGEYVKEHGKDGLSDGAEKEIAVIEKLFPDRLIQKRVVCNAPKGISCDYALHDGKRDICSKKEDCPFRKEVFA